jgi:NAD(P)-dependent dehydrogenase (short-subunit alcohol dehydrogenase family)
MGAAGKTFVVTGANTGIGRATVVALAAAGAARIAIASRSRERSRGVLDELAAKSPSTEVRFVALEMTDLAAVRRASDELLALDWPIDALVNNAGVAGVRGRTADGFELTFGTNHLAHFLWTRRLLPLVQRAKGRVVNVSSRGHYRATALDLDAVRNETSVTGLPEYFVSKLANVLHANHLARTVPGITTYSLHPGGVASDIWQRRLGRLAFLLKPFLVTNEEGARTQVHCATDDHAATETGLFYWDSRPRRPNPLALDPGLQDALAARSAEWIAPFMH